MMMTMTRSTRGGGVLLSAAQAGHIDVVKELRANGANVNAERIDGRTALMMAAFKDKVDVVKELLAKGADVNAKHSDGGSALMFANHQGYSEIAQLLKVQEQDSIN
jgi:uncharacterized protein